MYLKLYLSQMKHLLVPDLREQKQMTRGQAVVIWNVMKTHQSSWDPSLVCYHHLVTEKEKTAYPWAALQVINNSVGQPNVSVSEEVAREGWPDDKEGGCSDDGL